MGTDAIWPIKPKQSADPHTTGNVIKKTVFNLIHFDSILDPSINPVVKHLCKLLSRPRQCLKRRNKKQVQLNRDIPHLVNPDLYTSIR